MLHILLLQETSPRVAATCYEFVRKHETVGLRAPDFLLLLSLLFTLPSVELIPSETYNPDARGSDP